MAKQNSEGYEKKNFRNDNAVVSDHDGGGTTKR